MKHKPNTQMTTETITNPHAAGDAAHTPGPWREVINCQDYDAFPVLIYAGADFIAQVATDQLAEESKTQYNARLIAAAPELLEALKHADRTLGVVLSYFHGQAGQGLAKTLTAESVDEIRATLAKLEHMK